MWWISCWWISLWLYVVLCPNFIANATVQSCQAGTRRIKKPCIAYSWGLSHFTQKVFRPCNGERKREQKLNSKMFDAIHFRMTTAAIKSWIFSFCLISIAFFLRQCYGVAFSCQSNKVHSDRAAAAATVNTNDMDTFERVTKHSKEVSIEWSFCRTVWRMVFRRMIGRTYGQLQVQLHLANC